MVIKEWILNIISVAILGVLLDIVLPGGSLKKYTRFIVGLITLIVVLNPVLNILNQLPALGKKITTKTFFIDMESLDFQSRVFKDSQDRQLKELFEKKLENHIAVEIKRITDYSDIRVKVRLKNTDSEQIGRIDGIYLDIGKEEQRTPSIKPIEIAVSSSKDTIDKEEEPSAAEKREQEKIRSHIADTYEIEKSKIHFIEIP